MRADLMFLDMGAVFAPAWAAIQRRHPTLPDCAFRLDCDLPGALARCHAPGGWANRPALAVEFRPDGMDRPPPRVFGILLHEAAHMLDWARWGQISGHQSRFAWFAQSLGLDTWREFRAEDFDRALRTATIPSYRAWQRACYRTKISAATREVYAGEIAALGDALTPWAEALAAWRCPCKSCDRSTRRSRGRGES